MSVGRKVIIIIFANFASKIGKIGRKLAKLAQKRHPPSDTYEIWRISQIGKMASFGQRTNRIRLFSSFIIGDVIKRSKVNAVNVVKFSHDMPFFANLANFLPLNFF